MARCLLDPEEQEIRHKEEMKCYCRFKKKKKNLYVFSQNNPLSRSQAAVDELLTTIVQI